MKTFRGTGRNAANAEKWIQDLRHLRWRVKQRVSALHEEQNKRYQRSHKSVDYSLGERVWVRNLPHQSAKLDPLWTVPCEILFIVGKTGSYKVALPHGVRDVLMERLKLYLPKVEGLV